MVSSFYQSADFLKLNILVIFDCQITPQMINNGSNFHSVGMVSFYDELISSGFSKTHNSKNK